jgi:hypothetical protein
MGREKGWKTCIFREVRAGHFSAQRMQDVVGKGIEHKKR